jgi:hypothetical protein
MTVRRIALLALALAAPALAAAQPRRYGPPPPADRGFVLSARLGYGMPGGEISDETAGGFALDPPLDDFVDSKIPIWFEVGYRFDPRFVGGVFLEVAPASIESDFCFGTDCNGSNVRFGLDLQFHFGPHAAVDPWIGFGFAVEFLNAETGLDIDGDGFADVVGDITYAGWEFPLLEAGLDIPLTPRFSLGPYATISFAQYTSITTDLGGGAERRDPIDDQAFHSWFQLGVKGTLKL